MKAIDKLKIQTYVTPRLLQLTVVFGLGLMYVTQLVLTTMSVASQLHYSRGLGSLSYLVAYQLAPLLLFAVTYWLNPRKLTPVTRMFETMLIIIAGFSVWSTITYALPAFAGIISHGNVFTENFGLFEIISISTLVAVYVAILVWARRTKRW